MTADSGILFGGGEMNEFGFLSGTIVTAVDKFDPLYARCALKPTTDTGIQWLFSDRLLAYLQSQDPNDCAFWFGYRWKGGGGFTTGGIAMTLYDLSGKPFFRLRNEAPGAGGGTIACQYSADGFTTPYTLQPASLIAQPGTPTEYSFFVRRHPTDGVIEWYINQTLWWSSGLMNTVALINTIPLRVIWGIGNSNGDSYISEVMATKKENPVLGKRLCTLVPTADSATYDQWSNTFAEIAEIVENLATQNSTPDPNKIQLYTVSDLPVLGSGIVPECLILSGKFQTQSGVGIPQNLQGFIRMGGNDYPGEIKAAPLTPDNVQFFYDVDPSTNQVFLPGAINGAEMGYKSLA